MKRNLLSAVAMWLALATATHIISNARAQPRNHQLASAAPPAKSDDVEFAGSISFQWPGHENSVDARYEYHIRKDSGQGRLSISAIGPDGKSFRPYQFEPPVGQQFLRGVYPVRFGRLGDFLCLEWDYGASSLKLTILRLTARGTIEAVFDDACPFGFHILDVSADGLPSICGGYGNLGGPKRVKVFQWDGEKFAQTASAAVAEPHSYAIVTNKPKVNKMRFVEQNE